MKSVSRFAKGRRPLTVEHLEERANPATGVFGGGTLTITPNTGENITVSLNTFNTPGFLQATAGAATFFSSSTTQNVQNIVVKGNAANTFTFNLAAGTTLNNLTINGAQTTTTVALNPSVIAGALTFNGKGTSNDTVTLGATVVVGQSATFNMGAGNNVVNLNGLIVGKNLTINGKEGADTVNVAAAPVSIGGNWNLGLGHGVNAVTGAAAQTIRVGKNISVIGGNSQDVFNMNANATTLIVGGNFTFVSNGVPATFFDDAQFAILAVGGNVNYVGSPSNDSLFIGGPTSIGGNVNMIGKAGVNQCSVNNTTLGGKLSFTGTKGTDVVEINGSAIGKNVTVSLGDNDLSGVAFGLNQRVRLGNAVANTVSGSLSITSGKQADEVTVQRMVLGGALTIKTGEEIDTVTLDDLDVSGITLLELGKGNDVLRVDTVGALTLQTRFAKDFTVKAGDGEDLLDLSFSSGTLIRFGGTVKLLGGLGTDTLQNWPNNFFVLPPGSHSEDFENGNF